MEIVPNVHLIRSGFVNQYLIMDGDGLTLIDAGLARRGRGILKAIDRLGHAPQDLRRILVTHADEDHAGGLAALQAASGARVYASPIEAEALAAGRSSRDVKLNGLRGLFLAVMSPWFNVTPVVVDETLTDGQILPVLRGLQVVTTPGHTPGHISLFAPTAGLLFTGDSLVANGDQLIPSREMYTWDMAQALESVKKQAALGATIVCPAHGPVIREAAGKFPELGG
ncbi:MAG: MBL fold metallo-hydrolase [Anaerolineales bacterium]|nr:MAG: MBL fold metallo-hydrolase [Anaerolineales bacterium]